MLGCSVFKKTVCRLEGKQARGWGRQQETLSPVRNAKRARHVQSRGKITVGGNLTVCKSVKDCYNERTGANYSL